MLEIGTYHFTYIENCRVCCTAVFFCVRKSASVQQIHDTLIPLV